MNTGKSFAVNLGSSTTASSNPSTTAPVLNIRGMVELTMLANGAKICLQIGVRSCVSISESASLKVLCEGLEKREEDFAAEIAKMVNG